MKKTASTEIKRQNRSSIFGLIRSGSGYTKQEIATMLQISLPTVIQNINELCTQGLISGSGIKGNTGGRRARTYSLVSDAYVSIGLDITLHHVTTVVVDLTGAIIYREKEKMLFEQSDNYYRYLGKRVRKCLESLKIADEKVLGVGMGVPGLVTVDNQTVFYGQILHFTGATRKEFSQYIPFPTILLNDASAAGFAEAWINPDLKTAFYVLLSNNVGGSVVINGQTYSGDHFHSGEVGHITIVENGRLCYCGRRGCADSYLAATELSQLTDGRIDDYFALLEKGDREAKKRWAGYTKYLARTVNTVHMLFDCPVILGGYVGSHIDKYITEIRNKTGKLNSFEKNADYLYPCSYKTEAIAAGGALYHIDHFLKSI